MQLAIRSGQDWVLIPSCISVAFPLSLFLSVYIASFILQCCSPFFLPLGLYFCFFHSFPFLLSPFHSLIFTSHPSLSSFFLCVTLSLYQEPSRKRYLYYYQCSFHYKEDENGALSQIHYLRKVLLIVVKLSRIS